jgi:hypothetical protein
MAHRTVLVSKARNCLSAFVFATLVIVGPTTRDADSAYSHASFAQQDVVTLDFTKPAPPAEQGRRGVPGGQGGSDASPPYKLPLRLELLEAAVSSENHYTIRATIKNIGNQDFKLPVWKDLTEVEKSGNKSQKLFFFLVKAIPEGKVEPVGIGDGVVGASASLPNSTVTLEPGQSASVILPLSMRQIERALRGSRREVEVRVFCNEWQMDESRYATRASSEELVSTNSLSFVLQDGKLVAK